MCTIHPHAPEGMDPRIGQERHNVGVPEQPAPLAQQDPDAKPVNPLGEEAPGRAAVAVAALLSFGITFVLGLVVLSGYTRVSPMDELQHIDASIKAASGHWVMPVGELVGQEAMRIEACSGIDANFTPPPCDTDDFDPSTFQELGINTAAGRPSTYYVVTGYGARLIGQLTGRGFLEAARIASLLGHCLGVALLASLATRLGRSAVLGTSIAVIAGLIPPVLSQAVTVNPDSWSYLASMAVVTVTLAVRDWRPVLAIPALTTTLALVVLVKGNFAVLLLVPPFIALLGRRASSLRGTLSLVIAPFASAAVVFVMLVGIQVWASGNATPGAPVAPMSVYLAQSPTNPWSWISVANQVLYSLVPTTSPGIADPLESPNLAALSMLLGALLFGVSAVGVFSARFPSLHLAFSWSALAVMIGAPVLTFGLMYVSGLFFPYPQRYGYPAIPLACLSWASLPNQRRSLVAVTAAGVVGALVLVVVDWRA